MSEQTSSVEPRVTTPDDREIHTELDLDASRHVVWRAHTEPELLSRWWGRGNPVRIELLELRKDGGWRFTEEHDGPSTTFMGEFREVTPENRMVQTFSWEGNTGSHIINETDFEELPGQRTRIRTVSRFETKSERDEMMRVGMPEGQRLSYVALQDVLSGLQG